MIKIASANPPQNGSVTHHHDQSITPVSLSTTNATPNSPTTPIPLLLDELPLLISILPCFFYSKFQQSVAAYRPQAAAPLAFSLAAIVGFGSMFMPPGGRSADRWGSAYARAPSPRRVARQSHNAYALRIFPKSFATTQAFWPLRYPVLRLVPAETWRPQGIRMPNNVFQGIPHKPLAGHL